MSQNRDYGWYRKVYQDISGSQIFAAATDDTTLFTAKANHTVFIQRIVVYILTDAAQSMSFEDSSGSPVRDANIPASPGVDTRWDFDFTERGKPLTEGKNFLANVSAAGLAAHIEWMGYMKPTSAYAAF